MDKLKNILNPGSKKDDEVMYGSGQSDDPVLSSQGSHLSDSRKAGDESAIPSTNPSLNTTSGPLSTSTNPTGTSQYDTTGSGKSTQGLKEPQASRMPGSFEDDADTTASIISGTPGDAQSKSELPSRAKDPNVGTDAKSSFSHSPEEMANHKTSRPADPISSVGGVTEPSKPSTAQTSNISNSTPEQSRGLNSSEYSNEASGSGIGRDVVLDSSALGTGSAANATAYHRHGKDQQQDNHAPAEGRSFPLGGNTSTKSGTPQSYTSGQTGVYPAVVGSSATNAGAHSPNLTNKADPRVDSNVDGPAVGQDFINSNISDAGSNTKAGHSSLQHGSNIGSSSENVGLGRDTGIDTASRTELGWQHDHVSHGHKYEGDPCETTTGSTATHPLHTSGPHQTDTANLLDPKIGGDNFVGTSSTRKQEQPHQSQHPSTQEAPITSEVAEGGFGLSSKDNSSGTAIAEPISQAQLNTTTKRTVGPHQNDLLNKLDPRVDSDLSKRKNASATDPSVEAGDTRHIGRDGAFAGGAGAMVYEAGKHHGAETQSTQPARVTNSPLRASGNSNDDPLSTTTHVPTPAVDKASNNDNVPKSLPFAADNNRAETRDLPSQPMQASNVHGEPSGRTGTSVEPLENKSTTSDHPASAIQDKVGEPRQQHHARDADLAGAGGVAMYEAERHHDSSNEPIGQAKTTDTPQEAHHYGRDAVAAGTVAGTGAYTGHELTKKDDLDKNDLGKDGAKEKEEKKNDKELQKEEKKREKEVEKEVKKHEKIVAKEEKEHEKEEKKHDKEEKKHGGILGLFHRDKPDKPDKELREEEKEGKTKMEGKGQEQHIHSRDVDAQQPLSKGEGSESSAQGETGIGHGKTTHDAYEQDPNKHNKLHKDPPAGTFQ